MILSFMSQYHPPYRVMLLQTMERLPARPLHLLSIRSQFKHDWTDQFHLAEHWPRLLLRAINQAIAHGQLAAEGAGRYRLVGRRRERRRPRPPPLPTTQTSSPTHSSFNPMTVAELTSERDRLLQANRRAEERLGMMDRLVERWRGEVETVPAMAERLEAMEADWGQLQFELQETLSREAGLRTELNEANQELGKVQSSHREELEGHLQALSQWLQQGQDLLSEMQAVRFD